MKSSKSRVIRSRKLERCRGRGTKTVPRRGGAKKSVSEAPDLNQTRQCQDWFADDSIGKEVHDGRTGNLKSCDSTVTSFLPEGESSSNESPSTWSTLHTVAERVAVEALLQLHDSTFHKDKRARLLSLTRALQERDDESRSPRNKKAAAAVRGQKRKSLRVVIKNCKAPSSASKKSVSRNRSYVKSLMKLNNKQRRTPIEKKPGSRKHQVQRRNSTSKQYTLVVRRKVSRKMRSLNQIVQSLTSKADMS